MTSSSVPVDGDLVGTATFTHISARFCCLEFAKPHVDTARLYFTMFSNRNFREWKWDLRILRDSGMAGLRE